MTNPLFLCRLISLNYPRGHLKDALPTDGRAAHLFFDLYQTISLGYVIKHPPLIILSFFYYRVIRSHLFQDPLAILPSQALTLWSIRPIPCLSDWYTCLWRRMWDNIKATDETQFLISSAHIDF